MYRKILISVNNDKVSEQAAREALLLARSHQAKVIFLAVLEHQPWQPGPPLPGFRGHDCPDLTAEARARVHGFAHEAAAMGLAAEAHVRHGHPVQEILQLAQEERADLIVLPAYPPGPLARHIDSICQGLEQQAPCPVLVFGEHAPAIPRAPRSRQKHLRQAPAALTLAGMEPEYDLGVGD